MRAREYLAYLKAKYPEADQDVQKTEALRRQVLEGIAKRTGNPQIVRDQAIKGTDEEYINQYILKPFLHSLPLEVSEKLNQVPVGALPIRDLNAYAIRSPGGDPLVVVNRGLMVIAYNFCLSQVFAAISFFEKKDPATTTKVEDIYRQIIRFFLGKNSHIRVPIEDFSGRDFTAAISILNGLETFVIGHELAHIFLSHLGKVRTHRVNFGENTHRELEFYERSQRNELEADRLAWLWFQDNYAKLAAFKDLPFSIVFSGPMYFFILLGLLEKNLPYPVTYTSHPSALTRLTNLIENTTPKNRNQLEKDDPQRIPMLCMWFDLLPKLAI